MDSNCLCPFFFQTDGLAHKQLLFRVNSKSNFIALALQLPFPPLTGGNDLRSNDKPYHLSNPSKFQKEKFIPGHIMHKIKYNISSIMKLIIFTIIIYQKILTERLHY